MSINENSKKAEIYEAYTKLSEEEAEVSRELETVNSALITQREKNEILSALIEEFNEITVESQDAQTGEEVTLKGIDAVLALQDMVEHLENTLEQDIAEAIQTSYEVKGNLGQVIAKIQEYQTSRKVNLLRGAESFLRREIVAAQ